MHRIALILCGVLLLFPVRSRAQTGVITGTVSTQAGESIPGASVAVLGEQRGSATNADGEYELTEIPAGDYILSVSFVGFHQALRPVDVRGDTVVEADFRLQPADETLRVAPDVSASRTVRVHLTSREYAATVTRKPTFELTALPSEQDPTSEPGSASVPFSLSDVERGVHTYVLDVPVPTVEERAGPADVVRIAPRGEIGNYDVIAETGETHRRGTVGTQAGSFEFSFPAAPRITSVSADPNPVTANDMTWFKARVQNAETVSWGIDRGARMIDEVGEGTTVAHTFETPGTYRVKVEATNSVGTNADTVTVDVQEEQEPPSVASDRDEQASPVATFTAPSGQQQDAFGTSVLHVGDVNGDGTSDLLVGSPGASVDQKENAGRAYVMDGTDQSMLASYTSPNPESGGRFGASASITPTPDGSVQLAIGAPGESVEGKDAAGRTYVYRLEDVRRPTVAEPVDASGRSPDEATPRVEVEVPETEMRRPNGVAVVIGVEDYENEGVDDARFAVRDARVMRTYLTKTLGFAEENVIVIENATGTDLERVFGTDSNPDGRLSTLVTTGKSEVFVYFSGRAQWDPDRNGTIFAGSDVDPAYLSGGGYPVDQLYENLAKLEAKSATVVVDAPISGDPRRAREAAEMTVTVENPIMTMESGLLFTAGSVGEERSVYPETQHGLLTHFFLTGLRGEADGNDDQVVTGTEMGAYLKEKVPYWSKRLHNKSVTPHVIGRGKNRVLVEYESAVPADRD